MPEVYFDNGRVISEKAMPYFVAEVNSSHFGDLQNAFDLISAAKQCGCDCVKFQSWTVDSLYSSDYYKDNPIAKRIVSKFSLSKDDLFRCFEYCNELGIDFASTPYSNQEVDFLCDNVKTPFIKIASMEINNISFLKYIAKKKKAIVLSTGMSSIDEVVNAVNIIRNCGNDKICILHCVSSYPAKPEIINLHNISLLKDTFADLPIGYSDHSIGTSIACGAIALGACVIEKHFTLDNSKIGMDNNMATEPQDMKRLVDECKSVFNSLGSYERNVSVEEESQKLLMRRSIVANKDLDVGVTISEDDICYKRPGNGIPPDKFDVIVGKKTLNKIYKDSVIKIEDIQLY